MDRVSVRTRARGKDQFAGLIGAAYIKARGLTAQPNHHVVACEHCAQQEMLPAIQRICAAFQHAGAPARFAV